MTKRAPGGGLGISLEGTVDVEEGVEVRPHHYIRSILPCGPVGATRKFWNGDQLLEVRKYYAKYFSKFDSRKKTKEV